VRAEEAVRCALGASPELRGARANVAAVSARRVGARLLLPANPVASAQLEGTVRPGPNAAVNSPTVEWQVTLTQTIEVAGQRGRRIAVNDAEASVENRRRTAVAQEVAATTLRAELYRRVEVARARLRLLVDAEDADAADGWPPAPSVDDVAALTERALASRADLAATRAEREVAERQAALFRRARVPDLTLSLFTGNNVLGEGVVGGAA